MKYNLNYNVKVKITAKGHEILRLNYEQLLGKLTSQYPYEPPKIDEDGYSEMQLWEVAHQFGAAMYNGCDAPIETEIILPEVRV